MSGTRSRLTSSPPAQRRYSSGVTGSMVAYSGSLVGTDAAPHVENQDSVGSVLV
jgi:hypothetical protein